jgi:hypothetical protein
VLHLILLPLALCVDLLLSTHHVLPLVPFGVTCTLVLFTTNTLCYLSSPPGHSQQAKFILALAIRFSFSLLIFSPSFVNKDTQHTKKLIIKEVGKYEKGHEQSHVESDGKFSTRTGKSKHNRQRQENVAHFSDCQWTECITQVPVQ